MFSSAAFASAAFLIGQAALAQAAPETAVGQPPAAETPSIDEASAAVGDVEDDTPVRPRPLPRDDRTGTFSAFAGANVVVPGGDLGGGVSLADVAGVGVAAEAGLAIGITRYAGLQLRGQYGAFARANACPDCTAQMFAVGLGLTYHTSQALAFDPWVRFGAGYRGLLVAGPVADLRITAPAEGLFHGVDVASFALGGDFYPVRWLGVGLFFSGDVGIDVSAPSADARGSVYGLFQAGLRIALEPQRKAPAAASAPPVRRTAIQERVVFAPPLYNRAAE